MGNKVNPIKPSPVTTGSKTPAPAQPNTTGTDPNVLRQLQQMQADIIAQDAAAMRATHAMATTQGSAPASSNPGLAKPDIFSQGNPTNAMQGAGMLPPYEQLEYQREIQAQDAAAERAAQDMAKGSGS